MRAPYDDGAEKAVLGSLLLKPALADIISGIIKPEDLYLPAHQYIYQAILDLDGKGISGDPILVSDRLQDQGRLEEVGGRAFVHTLVSTATPPNAKAHAKVLKKLSVLRQLQRLGMDLAEAKTQKSLEELLDLVAKVLDRLEGQTMSTEPISLASAVTAQYDRLQMLAANGGGLQGYSTGFPTLDAMTGGLVDGRLIIIAARPAMGKTTLALQLSTTIAQQSKGGAVLFMSIEQPQGELSNRLISNFSRIPGTALQSGHLSSAQWQLAANAVGELHNLPLFIDDGSHQTPQTIRATCRRFKRKHGLAAVFLDYLQLVQPNSSRDSREREVAETTFALKAIAKDLEVPVIALSQLNRRVEGRLDKRPELSDLRESGAAEQDADQAMFIYRDEYYNPDSADRGVAELGVKKNRHGPTGVVRVAFRPDCGTFLPIPERTLSDSSSQQYAA